MDDEFWTILKSQPGVGVQIIDADGRVHYSNPQARLIYYGNTEYDPVGKTIAEIEGPEFAAERMQVVGEVLASNRPRIIRHIRGGKNTEATIWPLHRRRMVRPCVLALTRQGLADSADQPWPVYDSQLVDLGPLDVLTPRELQVMALIGHGVPLKSISSELGVSQRTVERYRTDIARKLRINSIAEIARLVQRAGLDVEHADMDRLHRWREATVA